MDHRHKQSLQYLSSLGKGENYPGKGKDTISTTEYKKKLKHQLEIWRRLQQLGLFAAATESRKKAHVLLLIYKRHLREHLAS